MNSKLPGGLRLWVTLASLGFVGWALAGHVSGLQELTITARGWWWLLLGLALSWLSLVVNAIGWRVLVDWLGHDSEGMGLVPLHLRTNLLKYLPGGIWHFVDRLRTLQPAMGANRALVSVLLEPLVMAVAALLWVPFGGWQSGLALVCVLPAVVLVPRWRDPCSSAWNGPNGNSCSGRIPRRLLLWRTPPLEVAVVAIPGHPLGSKWALSSVVLPDSGVVCRPLISASLTRL